MLRKNRLLKIYVKRSVMTCANASVEIDSNVIQFNMPELFVE